MLSSEEKATTQGASLTFCSQPVNRLDCLPSLYTSPLSSLFLFFPLPPYFSCFIFFFRRRQAGLVCCRTFSLFRARLHFKNIYLPLSFCSRTSSRSLHGNSNQEDSSWHLEKGRNSRRNPAVLCKGPAVPNSFPQLWQVRQQWDHLNVLSCPPKELFLFKPQLDRCLQKQAAAGSNENLQTFGDSNEKHSFLSKQGLECDLRPQNCDNHSSRQFLALSSEPHPHPCLLRELWGHRLCHMGPLPLRPHSFHAFCLWCWGLRSSQSLGQAIVCCTCVCGINNSPHKLLTSNSSSQRPPWTPQPGLMESQKSNQAKETNNEVELTRAFVISAAVLPSPHHVPSLVVNPIAVSGLTSFMISLYLMSTLSKALTLYIWPFFYLCSKSLKGAPEMIELIL